MEWTDRDNDDLEYDGEYIITSQQGFLLTPTIAQELSAELLKWADIQKVAASVGKRYLTRDWEVVKYDGTQDVIARVWRNKHGRFEPDEMVIDVAHKIDHTWKADSRGPIRADSYSKNVYYVRVSDLPDDMKGGPK